MSIEELSFYSQEGHYAVFAGLRLEALGQADTFGDRAAGTEEYIGPGEDDDQTVMAFGCVFIARPNANTPRPGYVIAATTKRPNVRGRFLCIFT